jgi:predicted ribonuclease YlaK
LSKKLKFDTSNLPSDCNVRELGNRKKFHPKDLISFVPLNPRQQQLWQSYYSGTPLIFLSGYPGVGKTFCALYLAFSEVLDSGNQYDKVVIVRSAVPTRSQGFLPGELEEKEEPYKTPYRAIVDELFVYNSPFDNLVQLKYLEFLTTSFIRGITIKNAVIVVDEINNFDWKELKSVITRCDESSRILLMGDESQEDLSRIRQTNGIPRLRQVVHNMPMARWDIIDFKIEDIVRSGLIQDFIISDMEIPHEEQQRERSSTSIRTR